MGLGLGHTPLILLPSDKQVSPDDILGLSPGTKPLALEPVLVLEAEGRENQQGRDRGSQAGGLE